MVDNAKYWNDRAHKYGHTGWSNEIVYHFDQKVRIETLKKLIIENTKDLNNLSILDFGGGDGTVAKAIAPLVNRYYYYDLSSEIMKIAKERLKDCGNIVYYQSFEELSKSNNKFDVIIVITVFQHILENSDLINTLKDLHNKLEDNGKLIILEDTFSSTEEINNYIHFRPISLFEKIINESGFSINKTYGFYHPFNKSTEGFIKYYHSFSVLLYKIKRKIFKQRVCSMNFDKSVDKYIGAIENYIFQPDENDTSRFYICNKDLID